MAVAEDKLVTRFSIEVVDSYVSGIAQIRAALVNHQISVDDANKKLTEMSEQTFALRRANMIMRTEWRMNHSAMLEFGRVLNDVGSIGRNVTQMFQAYSIAQMRVSDAQKDITSAESDAIIIQDELNRARARGNIQEIMNLTLQLSHAQDKVKKSTDELSRVQQENIIGYIGMGLQIGDIIARLPLMALHIQMLRGYMIEQTTATTASTAATITQTAADVGHTVAIKAKAAALSIMHALSGPTGWAILAGAAVVGAGALAWSMGGRQQTNTTIVNYSPTVYGGMSGLSEDKDELIDSLRRRGIG